MVKNDDDYGFTPLVEKIPRVIIIIIIIKVCHKTQTLSILLSGNMMKQNNITSQISPFCDCELSRG